MKKYTVLRSKRKTVSIEINNNLEIIIRAPNRFPNADIQQLILSYDGWIDKHLKKKEEWLKNSKIMQITENQIEDLKRVAKEVIPQRVAYYSRLMQLYPSGIKITAAKKRFGSCSAKNSLCFSLYLMAYPIEAIDYVVVHELAHIQYKNHGKDFYMLIAKYLPDYKIRKNMLQ